MRTFTTKYGGFNKLQDNTSPTIPSGSQSVTVFTGGLEGSTIFYNNKILNQFIVFEHMTIYILKIKVNRFNGDSLSTKGATIRLPLDTICNMLYFCHDTICIAMHTQP